MFINKWVLKQFHIRNNELKKIGAKVEITENSIFLNERTNEINENVPIETYNDHRMAMAFAPLALISNMYTSLYM